MDKERTNGTRIILWIFAIIVFPTLFFTGSQLIAVDKEARERDMIITDKLERIKDEQNAKLDIIKSEQNKKFTEILMALTELKTRIRAQ